MSNNDLQTTIPQWIGEWNKLKVLALDGNFLQGTIPPSFLELSSLRKFVWLLTVYCSRT
jgi:hypothetical protein